MKKIAILLYSLSLAAAALADNYTLSFNMCYFMDKDGNDVFSNANYAFVAFTGSEIEISAFDLMAGDSFAKNSWLNDDSSTGIYTFDIGQTYDSQVTSQVTIDNTTLPFEVTGDENLAVIVWMNSDGSASSTVGEGDSYVIFSPTMFGGETGDVTDPWTLVLDNRGNYNLSMLVEGAGGKLPDSYATLSKVVVPEPAAMAARFGALALAMAAWRRSKK